MKRINPLVKTIQIDQDNFISDFKKNILIWSSFDEPLINIQANNVTISNLDLHVKDNNKSPAVVIGNSTKMLDTITLDSITISCISDVFHILNVKNIKISKCIFRSKDIRTNIFVLSNVFNIIIDNCIIDGGNCSFLVNDTTGMLSKNKISNSDFVFNFTSGSSRWKVINNNFNNIQNIVSNKGNDNLFITYGNQFHSSNSKGFLNNLNEFTEDQLTSRDPLTSIGGIFGLGGGIPGTGTGTTPGTGTTTTPPIPSVPGLSSLTGGSYSITQIITFVAISFVLLVIVIVIIVFAHHS